MNQWQFRNDARPTYFEPSCHSGLPGEWKHATGTSHRCAWRLDLFTVVRFDDVREASL